MTELIITEKPKSAQKIAATLSGGKAKKHSQAGVPYYEFERDGKKIFVASTVGHIYSLDETEKSRDFPTFKIEWKPSSEVSKGAAYTKKYATVLKKLSKEADEFTVATDYDIEGEVIGYNIIRFISKQKDASRMKYSTLTNKDLEESYEHKFKTIDWPQALAGETRHMMDWYYGINLSRALTDAIKKGGIFKIMSTGRVQGPALKIVSDRERSIKAFKPEDYWEIEAMLKKQNSSIDVKAQHTNGKFWKEEEAKSSFQKAKSSKTAKVTKKSAKKTNVRPPNPFDLTSLQGDSYGLFKIKPAQTLEIAQELYTSGLISYPRTSSQQLPSSIGYKSILKQLAQNSEYKMLAEKLISKDKLEPNNGKKTDPAHPAIYPTGNKAKLDGRQKKVYDLIVKRFMATFGENAVRETVTAEIDINTEPFAAKGTTTLVQGWYEFYQPYVRSKEEELPKIEEGEVLNVEKIDLLQKETQPPKRFTPASLVKELEKRGLGTKATRASIIETLYDRHYVKGESIEVTQLGLETIDILEKYLPRIVDENLTKSFEEEMDTIREDRHKQDEILLKAEGIIREVTAHIREKDKEIGKELVQGLKTEQRAASFFGVCPVCKEQGRENGELVLKKGKFGRFVACSNYPDCTVTVNVPNKGILKPTEKVCEHCNYPIAVMGNNKKNSREVCINPKCPSKNNGAGQIEKHPNEGKECPKCKKGKLVLRNSVYGAFLGCSNYPKCRYTEKIDDSSNEKNEDESLKEEAVKN